MIEWNNPDRPHRGHHTSTGARHEISNIGRNAVANHTRADHDHRSEVGETDREPKELIASLKHQRLYSLGGL
jgi:hypothetical protein